MSDLIDPRATARLATDLAFEGNPDEARKALDMVSVRWSSKMQSRITRIRAIMADPHMDSPELIEQLRSCYMRIVHLKGMHANVQRFRAQLSPDDALDTELTEQLAQAMTQLNDAVEHARRDLGDAIHACNQYAHHGRVTTEQGITSHQPGGFTSYAGPRAHPATRAGADVLLRQAAHVLVEL